MSDFVLDCSIAASWLFEDEVTPETDRLLESLTERSAHVPGLWYLELGNVMIQAERRGRISASQMTAGLELLSNLPIIRDPESENRAFRETLELARTYSLTTYDAAYLELALRKNLTLATQDKALRKAALKADISVEPN